MDAEVLFCTLSLVFAFACAFFIVAGVHKALRRARARARANSGRVSGVGAGVGSGACASAYGVSGAGVSVGNGSGAGAGGWTLGAGAGGWTSGANAGADSTGAFDVGLWMRVLRNGIPVFNGVARGFMRLRVVKRFVSNVCEWMRARGIVTNEEATGSVMIGVLLGAGVLASIVARNVVAGLAVDALIVMVLVLRIQAWRDAQDDALRDGVPNSLSVMGECFQSGYSLVQTMQMVADQSEGKLAQVFGKCANMLQLGASSGEALGALRANAKVGELSFVAVALDVQHQTGGSIVSVLGTAEQMVQDRIDLRRSLQVQTAQARLSARVVCVMPFVLAFILSMVSEGFLAPFFSSTAGLAMLGLALVMEGGGVVMVRRMLKTAM